MLANSAIWALSRKRDFAPRLAVGDRVSEMSNYSRVLEAFWAAQMAAVLSLDLITPLSEIGPNKLFFHCVLRCYTVLNN